MHLRSLPIVVVVVAVGCRKEPPQGAAQAGPAGQAGQTGSAVVAGSAATAGSAAVGSAAPVDAGAGDDAGAAAAAGAPIELLHSVAATVTVSSTVKNKAILPAHLVDRDLKTAWNSMTGELVGAWLEVSVPAGTQVSELRMTVGYTATGPKGEDYFTMNPRIKAIEVVADGESAGKFRLDVARRDLQPIAVKAARTVRVVVTEVQRGSKPAWREISVSELEVWGTPPPGWTAPARPLTPKVEVAEDPLANGDPCADIEAQREAFAEAHKNEVYTHPDHSYPPTCAVVTVTPPADPAWANLVAWCDVYDEIYGPTTCSLDFHTRRGSAGFALESQHASSRIKVPEMTVRDVVPGGGAEMIVRAALSGREYAVVCRAAPVAACTEPMLIADGVWRTSFQFEAGKIVFEKAEGDPPADALGAKALVFK
jgi:hypothetical protein